VSGGGTTPSDEAKLDGTITDSDTLQPLAEVSVTLTSNGESETVLTDTEGKYLFSELTAGDYAILAEKVGYVSAESTLSLAKGKTAVFDIQMVPVV
jgi:hypothetical protein